MPDNQREERMEPEIYPLGDAAVSVQLGSGIDPKTHRQVQALAAYLERHPFPGLIEIVPAFVTVTVFYDPLKLRDPATGESCRARDGSGFRSPYEMIRGIVKRAAANLDNTFESASNIVHIPVCYGGELGPDLNSVAEYHGLTPEEVIEIHSSQDYLVYMIGFAPGFPYLGGLSERIATPRRSTPRLQIEAGTVGIGGNQTGIYPISTPGGWQLIGRTPLPLFRPDESSPSLLKAGDIVRFQPIGLKQFEEWREDST